MTLQRLLLKRRYPKRHLPAAATGDPAADALLAQISETGFAMIPAYLSREECETAIADFERTCGARSECVHIAEDRRLYGLETASAAARRFHGDPLWTRLSQAYALEPQTVFCVMANRIDHDGSDKHGSGGCWHRDGFDRELKVIVYLTDVGEENGPIQYVTGSHRSIVSDMKAGGIGLFQYRLGSAPVARLLKRQPSRLAEIRAAAGTAIVIDDSGIHRGAPIRAGTRYALTNYIFARDAVTPAAQKLYEPMLA